MAHGLQRFMRADSDARDRQNRPRTPYQGRLDTSVPLIAPATSGGSVTLVEVSLDMAPVEVAPSRRNMRVDVLRVHPACSRMGGRKVGCAHAAQSEPPHLRHQTLQHLVPHGPARLYRVRSGNQEAEDVGTSVSFGRAEPPSQVLAQPELQTPARHFSRLPWGL